MIAPRRRSAWRRLTDPVIRARAIEVRYQRGGELAVRGVNIDLRAGAGLLIPSMGLFLKTLVGVIAIAPSMSNPPSSAAGAWAAEADRRELVDRDDPRLEEERLLLRFAMRTRSGLGG